MATADEVVDVAVVGGATEDDVDVAVVVGGEIANAERCLSIAA